MSALEAQRLSSHFIPVLEQLNKTEDIRKQLLYQQSCVCYKQLVKQRYKSVWISSFRDRLFFSLFFIPRSDHLSLLFCAFCRAVLQGFLSDFSRVYLLFSRCFTRGFRRGFRPWIPMARGVVISVPHLSLFGFEFRTWISGTLRSRLSSSLGRGSRSPSVVPAMLPLILIFPLHSLSFSCRSCRGCWRGCCVLCGCGSFCSLSRSISPCLSPIPVPSLFSLSRTESSPPPSSQWSLHVMLRG